MSPQQKPNVLVTAAAVAAITLVVAFSVVVIIVRLV